MQTFLSKWNATLSFSRLIQTERTTCLLNNEGSQGVVYPSCVRRQSAQTNPDLPRVNAPDLSCHTLNWAACSPSSLVANLCCLGRSNVFEKVSERCYGKPWQGHGQNWTREPSTWVREMHILYKTATTAAYQREGKWGFSHTWHRFCHLIFNDVDRQ